MRPIQRKNISIHESDEDVFEQLISAIMNHEVLLVVGKNFELNQNSVADNFPDLNVPTDLYKILLRNLNDRYGTEASDFSDLIADVRFSFNQNGITRKQNLYKEIFEEVRNLQLETQDINPLLIELINTGYFKFVLTTSFSPLTEMALNQKWGDIEEFNIFENKFGKYDIPNGAQDLNTPSVFYLFGKYSQSSKYVVTDNDALFLMRKLQLESSSSKIIGCTSTKYLLCLGCDQDDWLFRFLWYTLKSNNLTEGCISGITQSLQLERYLKRNNILSYDDTSSLVTRIIDAVNKRQQQSLNSVPTGKYDVFISYSRMDIHIVECLYKSLTDAGLNVWFDKFNLGGRGGDFMEKIKDGIRNTKVFLPVFTTSITLQRSESHPYRVEWEYASENVIASRGCDCCIPIIEKSYNFYDRRIIDRLDPRIVKEDGFIFDKECLDFSALTERIMSMIDNQN